jgi:hypothetical protein
LAGGAGALANVKSLDELRGKGEMIHKSDLLAEWQKILKVNYWPIFDIARRILEIVPITDSKGLIERIAETANKLLENRLMHSHDLTGAMFQRLIADRKFLAAYYTMRRFRILRGIITRSLRSMCSLGQSHFG